MSVCVCAHTYVFHSQICVSAQCECYWVSVCVCECTCMHACVSVNKGANSVLNSTVQRNARYLWSDAAHRKRTHHQKVHHQSKETEGGKLQNRRRKYYLLFTFDKSFSFKWETQREKVTINKQEGILFILKSSSTYRCAPLRTHWA